LRAPWCGLTLRDLHGICGADPVSAVWELIQAEHCCTSLSADGQARLGRVCDTLRQALSQRRRRTLRRLVEGAWLALGGPACVEDDTDLEDAAVFFELLDELSVGADLADLAHLAQRVDQLFALPDTAADASLQLMTIHKSKGLEFDIVIVPGLGRRPRGSEDRLLMWMEKPRGKTGKADLLLAPIKESGPQRDSIYDYLKRFEQQKNRLEDGRLLYVACTRAKRRLHLLGHVPVHLKDGEPVLGNPEAGSLLSQLWPVVEPVFAAQLAAQSMETEESSEGDGEDMIVAPRFRRLVGDWRLPDAPEPVAWERTQGVEGALAEENEAIEFEWAGETARHVGTVVHQFLQRIARDGYQQWGGARLESYGGAFAAALQRLGVASAELQDGVAKVRRALENTLADGRGRWLMETGHSQAETEYGLTGWVEGEWVNVVIDRTFVDDAGVRWIVDYKTSMHEGADLESFLDNEQLRYRAQLERYARLLSHLDRRPIRLGLYFPLLHGWREWEWKG
jgi:ATP-dependent helicase/nuclease subunit A